jgi:hypothetical protein
MVEIGTLHHGYDIPGPGYEQPPETFAETDGELQRGAQARRIIELAGVGPLRISGREPARSPDMFNARHDSCSFPALVPVAKEVKLIAAQARRQHQSGSGNPAVHKRHICPEKPIEQLKECLALPSSPAFWFKHIGKSLPGRQSLWPS